MKLLLYSPMTAGAGKRLQRVIGTLVPKKETEAYQTIDSLSHRLRQPSPADNAAVAVLLAATKEDLLDMLSIKDLIWNLRIILILPDTDDDTISQGHTLRPRFLTYADSDFAEVAEVLNKMLGNIEG